MLAPIKVSRPSHWQIRLEHHPITVTRRLIVLVHIHTPLRLTHFVSRLEENVLFGVARIIALGKCINQLIVNFGHSDGVMLHVRGQLVERGLETIVKIAHEEVKVADLVTL